MAGKGSRQRPTDTTKYESNWERIFNNPLRGPQTAPEQDQSQSNANPQGTHKSP